MKKLFLSNLLEKNFHNLTFRFWFLFFSLINETHKNKIPEIKLRLQFFYVRSQRDGNSNWKVQRRKIIIKSFQFSSSELSWEWNMRSMFVDSHKYLAEKYVQQVFV